ncbi:MAG: hypothetical protein ACK5S6_02735 [bacterium]|jgi:hypothetical protein
MKLEYGKRYVMRNGKITGPVKRGVLEDYPFTAENPDYMPVTWTEYGRQSIDTLTDSSADIVSEYCESVCEEPAPEVKRLQWVPGRTYKMRNGGLVFVILVDEGQSYPVTGFRLYPGEDAEQFPNTWTIHGKRHMGHVESSFDIVDYGYEVGDE